MKLAWLFGALAFLVAGCSSDAGTDSDSLYQGGSAKLWHTQTIFYCFVRPALAQMPAEVRAEVSTQQALEDRWMDRVHDFVAAIDGTWQALGVIDFVPRFDVCEPDNVWVEYQQKTTGLDGTQNGGFTAGLGQGVVRSGNDVEMNALFLTKSFAAGTTYHAFTAAHEMGHVLGFRHEQDRLDSRCNVSADRSGSGVELTPYDPLSIMNYCNTRQAPVLTADDRAGFTKAYAFVSSLPRTCGDTNSECGVWARAGECAKNPSYMQTNCCASCASSDPCRDENASCAAWASANQCNANPAYMQRSCCASCFR